MSHSNTGTSLGVYTLDLDKVDNGAWLHGVEGANHSFKVKRIRGLNFDKEMDDIKRGMYKANVPDFIDNTAMFANWLGKYGCTDWDGVLDYEGNPLPFDRETCINVFKNREIWHSLVDLLIYKASNNEAYYATEAQEAIEELKKR